MMKKNCAGHLLLDFWDCLSHFLQNWYLALVMDLSEGALIHRHHYQSLLQIDVKTIK